MGVYERQQREKKILESAIKLFSNKGYANSKMDDVAKEAKMSKGLIYFYYKNKEDLYMAVTKKAYEELKDLFSKTLSKDKNKTGIEIITDLVDNFFNFASENTMYQEAILNFMGLMAVYNNEKSRSEMDPHILESLNFQKLLDLHHEPAKIGIQIISTGIRDGSMRPDLQPTITFYTVWTMMIGYDRLKGPIEYENKDIKISKESWKNGFLKLLYDMLKGTYQPHKGPAIQGKLF